MKLRYILLLLAVFFVLGVGLGSIITYNLISKSQTPQISLQQSYEYQGKVTRIIDGDTIEVDGIRVRLVGVNTPERGEPGFNEATEFVRSLCPVGSIAGLDIDDKEPTDKYGRTLAVVYCGGVHVNRELLRRGYAEVMFIPPSEFDPYSWR
jgi:micrococcal nuclease